MVMIKLIYDFLQNYKSCLVILKILTYILKESYSKSKTHFFARKKRRHVVCTKIQKTNCIP